MPPPAAVKPAYVFDAYGTLFDVHSAVARHARALGPDASAFSQTWRRKQLEYSWVRALMGPVDRDFWQLTQDGLDYAFARFPSADPALRPALLDAYRELDCFPEVPAVLRHLKENGARLAILSNGSHEMLSAATRSAGIADFLDLVLSTQDCRSYKTSPEAYDLAVTAFRLYPQAVSFQSSNRWDIAGAARFGFRTVWINRHGEPDEYRDLAPDAVLADLRGLPGIA